MICSGVICALKMMTEPVTSRMSLNTPASVRTRPLPALTRKTAAMLSRNATSAFESRRSPLRLFVVVFVVTSSHSELLIMNVSPFR